MWCIYILLLSFLLCCSEFKLQLWPEIIKLEKYEVLLKNPNKKSSGLFHPYHIALNLPVIKLNRNQPLAEQQGIFPILSRNIGFNPHKLLVQSKHCKQQYKIYVKISILKMWCIKSLLLIACSQDHNIDTEFKRLFIGLMRPHCEREFSPFSSCGIHPASKHCICLPRNLQFSTFNNQFLPKYASNLGNNLQLIHYISKYLSQNILC